MYLNYHGILCDLSTLCNLHQNMVAKCKNKFELSKIHSMLIGKKLSIFFVDKGNANNNMKLYENEASIKMD